MRSKKVQLAILDEVAGKSDGINPVKIDLSDKTTDFNFWHLKSEGCFVFAHDSETQEVAELFKDDPSPVFPTGLSDKGHEYHAELAEWWERMELRRQIIKSADEANLWAKFAARSAGISALVAVLSMLFSGGAVIVSCFFR